MKAIHFRRTLVTLIFFFVSGGAAVALAQDMRPASAALAQKIATARSKKVAVVDFTDLQGNVTQLGRFIAEELSIALAGDAKDFEVIDRSSIRVILQEHKLASEGLIDPTTARKLGQIAGVDTLITGTITPLGDSVHVGLKALNTETARVLAGFSVEIPRTRAINDLLGASADGTAQARNDPQDPPAKQGTVAFRFGDFLFSFQGCMKGVGQDFADQIVCRGNVTNKGTQREEMAISNQTYLVDNTGHQSPINYESVGGDEGHPCCSTHAFEPDLPLQFWFDSRGYSDEVVSVNIIFLANGHKTILHNMRIQGQ